MMGGGTGGPKFGGLGGGLGGDYNIPSDEDSDDEEMPELDDIESETTVTNINFLMSSYTHFNEIELVINYYTGQRKREE